MSHDFPQGDPFSELSQRNQRGVTPNMEPPILSHYSDAPVYDIITLAALVKVKPITLWSWEQQLGISSGEPIHETDKRRHRTERDLVALLWVKEMVMAGESSQNAAARLIAAQRGRSGTGYLNSGALNSGALNSGALNSGALNSGALNSGALNSGALNSGALSTGALNPHAFNTPNPRGPQPAPTGALGSATYPGGSVPYPDLNASGVRPTPNAGMMRGGSGAQWGSNPRNPMPEIRPGGASGPLNPNAYGATEQLWRGASARRSLWAAGRRVQRPAGGAGLSPTRHEPEPDAQQHS